MSFSWIFAVIAGAVILFLAIYAASQLIDVAKHKQYTEAAASISILLDPLETGIASASGAAIGFKKETKTHYNCYTPTLTDVFGKQTIAFSEKSGFGKEWGETGGEITVRNKFIFVDKVEQGEQLYLFSKPFYMGFKVNDLIFASANEYCFVAPPNIIEEEVLQLTLENINITNSIGECGEQSEKVCFSALEENCDAVVYGIENDYDIGYVEKADSKLDYVGSLIYGAIFSAPEIYECNVQRLGAKTSELAKIYSGKIDIVKAKDCNSAIQPDLNIIAANSANIKLSSELAAVYTAALEMNEKEEDALCKIYS